MSTAQATAVINKANEGAAPPPINVEIAPIFIELFRPHRYKVLYGGRGGAKSWSIARALVAIAYTSTKRILCARELQGSISDSVHKLLKDQIELMGLLPWFTITQNSIVCTITGSEFIFKGLRHNFTEIKSTEGIDICWVEEAQFVTKDSWEVLIPTIRKQGSEIWISFNPEEEADETYKRFVLHPPHDCWSKKVGWQDNPWFPDTLEAERVYMLETDPEGYEHVWGGHPKTIGDAVIFKGKYLIEVFDTDIFHTRLFHGADWGFANDPTALVRCWVKKQSDGEHLYVDQESVGYGVEIDETPALFRKISTSVSWPIKADNSRPETISYVRRQGFNVSPADKWAGSVEDGIAHLKGFRKIHVHQRCKHLQQELRLYQYKVDKNTKDILPIIVDKNNHCIDALRYALDGYIKRRGDSVFARMG